MSKPATPTKPPTGYVILTFDPESDDWREHGDRVVARSSEAAIRAHLERLGGGMAGVYIAVPVRSWKPTTVTVETTTILKLDTA